MHAWFYKYKHMLSTLHTASIACHLHKHTKIESTKSITDIIAFITLPGVKPPHHLMVNDVAHKLKFNFYH